MPNAGSGTFQQIPKRNVFGLKEPEQPSPTNAPPQIPRLILTGITTILGNKRALLKEQPLAQPGRTADPAKDISYILTEGQREGSVEVLQIDEKVGSVKVLNSGVIMTLTFEKDGAKLPVTPPPGNAPGMAAGIGGVQPALPGVSPGTPPGIGLTNTLPRPPRGPRPATGAANAQGFPQAPSPTGRTAGMLPTNSAVQNISPLDLQGLTPEEQAIVLQLQRSAESPAAASPNPAAVSGTVQTPTQEGIAPAYVPPPLPSNPRPVVPQ